MILELSISLLSSGRVWSRVLLWLYGFERIRNVPGER